MASDVFWDHMQVAAIFSPPSVSRDRESRHFFWRDFTRPRDLDIRLVYYLSIFIFILVKSLQWWMLTFKLFWYPKSNLSDQLHQKLWMATYFNSLGISKELISASILEKKWKKLENIVFASLVSLVEYLTRLKPGKWARDETSLVVSNLGCRHYYVLKQPGLIIECLE